MSYLDDLRHDLQDEEYRFKYLSACAMDSGDALRIGIKEVLAAVRLEELATEKAAHELAQLLPLEELQSVSEPTANWIAKHFNLPIRGTGR